MRLILSKLAFVILIGVLMAISNPKPGEHRRVVKDSIMTDVLSNVKEPDGIGEGIGMGLGLMLGSGAIDVLIDLAQYRNFIVFSTLTAVNNNNRGSEEILSVGVFGNVIPLIDKNMKR